MSDFLGNLFGGTFAGIKGYIWTAGLALLVAAVFTVTMIFDNRDKRLIDEARDGGAAEAVNEGHKDTLKQVERANDAEDEIARGGDVERYERCLRNASARTRANCERFAPVPD